MRIFQETWTLGELQTVSLMKTTAAAQWDVVFPAFDGDSVGSGMFIRCCYDPRRGDVVLDGFEARAKIARCAPEAFRLAFRVSRLNREAEEIGAGMLAQLIDEARMIVDSVIGVTA